MKDGDYDLCVSETIARDVIRNYMNAGGYSQWPVLSMTPFCAALSMFKRQILESVEQPAEVVWIHDSLPESEDGDVYGGRVWALCDGDVFPIPYDEVEFGQLWTHLTPPKCVPLNQPRMFWIKNGSIYFNEVPGAIRVVEVQANG